jgi:flagellar biosynthesis protein FlhF
MNMKKFVAATSREALRLIRIEMGADAVILSNRKVDGGVEIMALASAEFAQVTQEPRQPTPVSVKAAIVTQERAPVTVMTEPAISTMQLEQQGILSEIKFMRNMMQEQMDCLSWSDRQQRDPQRTRMLRDLLNAGFSPALSRQMIDKMPAKANMEWVCQVLGNNLRPSWRHVRWSVMVQIRWHCSPLTATELVRMNNYVFMAKYLA